jgi:hypothetical protein
MRARTLKARLHKERDRTLEQIATRTETPKRAFWLSFAGDGGFRGAVIVHAEDFTTAVMECNLRGINPHGECQGMEIPTEATAQIPDKWKNRILSREECKQFDEEMSAGQG